MKYANTEINFTPERLVELLQLAIDGLRQDDENSAIEYFADVMEMSEYEKEFFGIPTCDDFDDADAWKDDSDIGCSACPQDECTGHCMSCSYRTF